jgi:hypothetical protein
MGLEHREILVLHNAILRTLFKEGCDALGKQRLRNTADK